MWYETRWNKTESSVYQKDDVHWGPLTLEGAVQDGPWEGELPSEANAAAPLMAGEWHCCHHCTVYQMPHLPSLCQECSWSQKEMCSYRLFCPVSSQPSYSIKKGCSEKLSEDTTKLQTTSQNQNYALISKDHHNMFKKGTHIACTSQDKIMSAWHYLLTSVQAIFCLLCCTAETKGQSGSIEVRK
jgi:hypothetical protein